MTIEIDLFDEEEEDPEDGGEYDESAYHEGPAEPAEPTDHAGYSGDDLPNDAFKYPEDEELPEREAGDLKL